MASGWAWQETEVSLSKRLKKEGVPFLAITNSNTEAKELYDSGCRYVIQQEYLAAKVRCVRLSRVALGQHEDVDIREYVVLTLKSAEADIKGHIVLTLWRARTLTFATAHVDLRRW